jgi:hypothetical protein
MKEMMWSVMFSVFVLTGCGQPARPPTQAEIDAALKKAYSGKDYRMYVEGIGDNAIRAEIGKFMLLRNGGTNIALRIARGTHPSKKQSSMLGADYELYAFESGSNAPPRKYTGEVYEIDGTGRLDHITITGGAFSVMWSVPSWIYFSQSVLAMARTQTTNVQDIDFADKNLKWFTRLPGNNKGSIAVPSSGTLENALALIDDRILAAEDDLIEYTRLHDIHRTKIRATAELKQLEDIVDERMKLERELVLLEASHPSLADTNASSSVSEGEVLFQRHDELKRQINALQVAEGKWQPKYVLATSRESRLRHLQDVLRRLEETRAQMMQRLHDLRMRDELNLWQNNTSEGIRQSADGLSKPSM